MSSPPAVLVVGAGPAGLMAATVLAEAGLSVTVADRMPSPGRKFLMAGRGGLNLTHSEPIERFRGRFREAADWLSPILDRFSPASLIAFAESLGQPTFVGSSGRVFPKSFKASPLLRAWLSQLAAKGVRLLTRTRWCGFDDAGHPLLAHEDDSAVPFDCAATVLALGGGSWPRLGSDGSWQDILSAAGVPLSALRPSNMGIDVAWSDFFRERFAGTPLKRIAVRFAGETVRGEAMITAAGLEGGAIYALSAPVRRAVEAQGRATLHMDLRPDLTAKALAARLASRRQGQSTSAWLGRAGLPPATVALLREPAAGGPDIGDAADRLKSLPLTISGVHTIERAISSAGGVTRAALDDNLMLHALPGVFCAGEMLDWEAPTGGYLLQACFATGVAAAEGVLARLGLAAMHTAM